jgi:hypothetical protein
MVCVIQGQGANPRHSLAYTSIVALDNEPVQTHRRESCKCRFSIVSFVLFTNFVYNYIDILNDL